MDYVLIHGSTQSSLGYERLVTELSSRGHTVAVTEFSITDPGWLAEDYAEEVARQLDVHHPVVVAHSAGGLLLPAIARGLRARRMAWLAAYVPHAGRSLLNELDADPSGPPPVAAA